MIGLHWGGGLGGPGLTNSKKMHVYVHVHVHVHVHIYYHIVCKKHQICQVQMYLAGGLAHAHGACPTFFWPHILFKMPLKCIFNLVSAAGAMLTGAQSQIVAVGHVKCIKLTTSA